MLPCEVIFIIINKGKLVILQLNIFYPYKDVLTTAVEWGDRAPKNMSFLLPIPLPIKKKMDIFFPFIFLAIQIIRKQFSTYLLSFQIQHIQIISGKKKKDFPINFSSIHFLSKYFLFTHFLNTFKQWVKIFQPFLIFFFN